MVVATNFSVSSRQGFKLLGLSPFTIPFLFLSDPCLSFTKYFSLSFINSEALEEETNPGAISDILRLEVVVVTFR